MDRVRIKDMRDNYIFIGLLALLGFSLLLSGCTREKAEDISLKEVVTDTRYASSKEKVMKIAVSAIISPTKTFLYYKEILDYVSRKVGVSVELVQRDTYNEVNALVKNQEIDAAFVCSGAYVDGHKEFGMELLVAPKAYGEHYYYSYIIVPADSDAASFEALRRKKFAFTDPLSNTGKLVPTYMLAMMGETPGSFFSETIFTYSHDKSIEAVAQKLVDGAAVDSLIWDYANATNPEFTSRTKIIKKSAPFGIPPVVVPQGLNPQLKEQLQDIFLNMHEDTEGKTILEKVKIDRFIKIEDSAYDPVREMKKFLDK